MVFAPFGLKTGIDFAYRVFSHDVTAAYWCPKTMKRRPYKILVSQNNEMAAILVSQPGPVGVELFSYATLSFVPMNLQRCWPRE